jgi:hypothetical protein
VCDTEVVIVKAPAETLDLRCGGHPMIAIAEERPSGLAVEPGFEAAPLIGKRYTDPSGELEVLCTKAGSSALSLGDELLERKDAKPLPSSD